MHSTPQRRGWPGANQEWLVTDRRGGFAMGTASGIRTRKYHGFGQAIAGRGEMAWLADLELRANGEPLWPHAYLTRGTDPAEAIVSPPLRAGALAPQFRNRPYPSWSWKLGGGALRFELAPRLSGSGGFRLRWRWESRSSKPFELELRPFFALRDLHGMGGSEWRVEPAGPGLVRVVGFNGRELAWRVDSTEGLETAWRDDAHWYYGFHYPEEAERGYLAEENLFSAGVLRYRFVGKGAVTWAVAPVSALEELPGESAWPETAESTPALDFCLIEPAGIVAGYPWFGEWGRDTFVSLPGLVAARLGAGENAHEVWAWARRILLEWGAWIPRSGMLPNLVEKGGSHQWESADATLWFTHALAGLWQLSLGANRAEALTVFAGGPIEEEMLPLLEEAIESIRSGRHLFLRVADDGLLEVTEPHATWMDARIDGAAVTPRVGKLPEINALWVQAQALQRLWKSADPTEGSERLIALARAALGCSEPGRPNEIFLHSVPLAPSFLLADREAARAGARRAAEEFFVPVGLRTLARSHPDYHPRCVGDQCERDRAYHQGPAWGWLGGHYEMARMRAEDESLPAAEIGMGPVPGHVPEIFDGDEPYAPRGAPAQAWSLACHEEAIARRKARLDAKLTRVLAARWIGREARRAERRPRPASKLAGMG